MESRSKPMSNLLVALAWLMVGLPAAWGVVQTLKTSMRLFQSTATPAAIVPAPVPPAR